jgi:hypothetical protein
MPRVVGTSIEQESHARCSWWELVALPIFVEGDIVGLNMRVEGGGDFGSDSLVEGYDDVIYHDQRGPVGK